MPESRPLALHEFLSAHRAAILARTRAMVAAGPAPRATEEELQSGIPLFFDQLIERLRGSHLPTAAMGESASLHGGNLLKRGFTVAQVVHTYGSVCQAVTELADEMNAPITADEFHTFNRCLDDAIAQAVTEFTRQRELSIADQGTERMGSLAHELRNALGAAMLAYQALRGGKVSYSGSTSALLGRSLTRLSTLIDSSLMQVRIESGLRAPERVSVRELLEEAEVGATLEANRRELTLVVTTVEPEVEVLVDRHLLAAAVDNLLQNAFKFTRPRSRVSLKASSTVDRVLIDVEDQCGGLPPGKAEALFGRFEQRGRDRTGLGLGLSISRKIIEAQGGELRVQDMPGQGCMFTIDLPRLPSATA